MLNRISSSDFANMIVEGIAARDKSLDTRIDAIRDLQIDPIAEVLEQQNNRVVYLSQLGSMKYADSAVPDDLDDIVFNEGVVRWAGSRAIVTITFARSQPPTSDIVVSLNFPVATPIDQSTGSSVVFRTIESKTMFAAAPSAYYNAETGKYELDVLAASVVIGANTEVGPYTVTVMRRPLPGFDEIFNVAKAEVGKSLESNVDLADRYVLHVAGSKPGVPNGIKRSVLDNFSPVTDAYVVYGNDTYLTREQEDAGAVDIWVLGSQPASMRYVTNYPGIEVLIPVDRQPLISVTSVRDSIGTIFVQGTDYEVVTDAGEYSYSVLGQDGIRFLSTAVSVPANLSDPVIIDYSYNSLINVLTSYYTQPEEFTMGQDKLFRAAQQIDILIEANLKVRSGNPSDVQSSVRSAVKAYINAMKLGMDVEEFDIDSVVSRVYGVDNFTYITLAVSTGSGVSDIAIGPNQYARIDDADLIINLV